MTSDFKTAYRFDDAGYFEHELSVQVIAGEALMPPSATLLPPLGRCKAGRQGFLPLRRRVVEVGSKANLRC